MATLGAGRTVGSALWIRPRLTSTSTPLPRTSQVRWPNWLGRLLRSRAAARSSRSRSASTPKAPPSRSPRRLRVPPCWPTCSGPRRERPVRQGICRGRRGLGVACTACCAGPVVAFLAAAGLLTARIIAMCGAAGLAVVVPAVAWHRRRSADQNVCATPTVKPAELSARPAIPAPGRSGSDDGVTVTAR